jgi:hypothetical protein
MKKKMESPEVLQAAFKVEKLFAPLETLESEKLFDGSANENAFDSACNETEKILTGIEQDFGRSEMQKCADRIFYYLTAKDYHHAARAVSMLSQGN